MNYKNIRILYFEFVDFEKHDSVMRYCLSSSFFLNLKKKKKSHAQYPGGFFFNFVWY